MKKIFNLVFALVLFSITANATEVATVSIKGNYTQVPTNPGEKNRANSGTDYYVDLKTQEGLQVFTGNSPKLNMPEGQYYQIKASDLSDETGKNITAKEVEGWVTNGEYVWMKNSEYTSMAGEKAINYATYATSATLDVDDHYDANEYIMVLTPKAYPGLYSPFLKNGCVNYQGGYYYQPTGDNDEDYSLPPSGSDATATATATVGDVDVTVYTGESESSDEGGDTYIENYYEAGETAGGSGMTQPTSYPYYDDQLFWSLGASWDQCSGWSFNGGLSNSPYGVGSGYGYGGYNSGYNSGFGQYCGENGFGGTYNTINNYYYGDVNSHNNNNINSGNTTFNWQQWVNNHQNGDDDDPPVVDDDDLPTNTGGIEGQATGDNLPGNNAGTTVGKQKQPSGFQKNYKKSKEKGDEVFYANAEQTKKDEGIKTGNQSRSNDKVDGTKAKNDVKANNEGSSKEQPEFYASADKQIKDQSNERSFEKKSEQEKNQPAEKQFEIKEKPVKQNNTASKSKVEQKKTNNVDENYDRPAKEYQKKKSPEVKKSAPVKKNTEAKKQQPVKKSTTVKGSGAKVKPNPSAKKGSGTKVKPASRKSAGSGQNYKTGNDRTRQSGSQNSKTRNSGSSPSPKRGGRS